MNLMDSKMKKMKKHWPIYNYLKMKNKYFKTIMTNLMKMIKMMI